MYNSSTRILSTLSHKFRIIPLGKGNTLILVVKHLRMTAINIIWIKQASKHIFSCKTIQETYLKNRSHSSVVVSVVSEPVKLVNITKRVLF